MLRCKCRQATPLFQHFLPPRSLVLLDNISQLLHRFHLIKLPFNKDIDDGTGSQLAFKTSKCLGTSLATVAADLCTPDHLWIQDPHTSFSAVLIFSAVFSPRTSFCCFGFCFYLFLFLFRLKAAINCSRSYAPSECTCACAPFVLGEVWGGGVVSFEFRKEIATSSLFLFRIWELKLFLTSLKESIYILS